jgi:hypothetical protein
VAYIADYHRVAARLGCDEVLELLAEGALLDESLDAAGSAPCRLKEIGAFGRDGLMYSLRALAVKAAYRVDRRRAGEVACGIVYRYGDRETSVFAQVDTVIKNAVLGINRAGAVDEDSLCRNMIRDLGAVPAE